MQVDAFKSSNKATNLRGPFDVNDLLINDDVLSRKKTYWNEEEARKYREEVDADSNQNIKIKQIESRL